MSKELSKQRFFNELNLRLSFHFNDNEIASVLGDYEEWFEIEASQGKSEKEICSDLERPDKIVKNLLSETNNTSSKLVIWRHNTTIQLFSVTFVRLFTELILLKICNRNAMNYMYFALIINFLYFIAGMGFFKQKQICSKACNYKENLVVLGFAALIIMFELLLIPRLDFFYSGTFYAGLFHMFSLVLFLINMYFIICQFAQNRLHSFIIVLHISGIMSLLFFFINRLHMLDRTMTEYCTKSIAGSVAIYIETVVLCLFFYAIKKCDKE